MRQVNDLDLDLDLDIDLDQDQALCDLRRILQCGQTTHMIVILVILACL